MIIDAHQHFWTVSRGDYAWMEDNPDVASIRRDWAPPDLDPLLDRHGIDCTVLVQAAATTAETDFLLGIAESSPRVAKVVGWMDFESKSELVHLERWAQHPKFSGVRPMIQDIEDSEWMHRDDVQWAYEALQALDLTFDALGTPRHLTSFERLFDRYPSLRTVIDHGMKPSIRTREFDDWAAAMARIAEQSNVLCKCSGLLTEARPGDGADALRPYVDHLREHFGAERLMWGSDWPVLTLAESYDNWFTMARALFEPSEQHAVFGATAANFYRID